MKRVFRTALLFLLPNIPIHAAPGWRDVARMPGPDHDISGAEAAGRFYVSGGCATVGNPRHGVSYDELWELTPGQWKWRVAAKLSRVRIYCATAALDGKVWIIDGDVIEAGKRISTSMVEIYDPATGKISLGPDTLFARPMPLALSANGRLYVAGNFLADAGLPGRLESIGPGETKWRREPDGPKGMAILAGGVLDGKLYAEIPGAGLAIFDPATGRWDMAARAGMPRSSEVAGYNGEVWIMGGRGAKPGNATLIYNPARHAWRDGPPIPALLSWGAAGTAGGSLLITGGAGEGVPGYFSPTTYALLPK